MPTDIDGMGHANNASYVVWCEQCAWQHSQQLGLNVEDYQRLDRGVAINKANYEYFSPCFEDDRIIVATWLTACDNKLRLERRFQIVNSRKQTLLRGHWLLISMILSSSRPAKMPAEFVKAYGEAVIKV